MPMAPRPSSPTISYLPALLTVSICAGCCERVFPEVREFIRADPASGRAKGSCRSTLILSADVADMRPRARAPSLAHYPAEFLEVNATGVPVFRTRYLAVWAAPTNQLRVIRDRESGAPSEARGSGLVAPSRANPYPRRLCRRRSGRPT